MQQSKLGTATFRKLATKDQPHPADQSCIVVGLNLDGTVNLVAYEADGQSYFYDKVKLVKAEDGINFHYQPQQAPTKGA